MKKTEIGTLSQNTALEIFDKLTESDLILDKDRIKTLTDDKLVRYYKTVTLAGRMTRALRIAFYEDMIRRFKHSGTTLVGAFAAHALNYETERKLYARDQERVKEDQLLLNPPPVAESDFPMIAAGTEMVVKTTGNRFEVTYDDTKAGKVFGDEMESDGQVHADYKRSELVTPEAYAKAQEKPIQRTRGQIAKDTIRKLNDQLKEVRDRNKSLRDEVSQLKAENNTLKKRLEKFEAKNEPKEAGKPGRANKTQVGLKATPQYRKDRLETGEFAIMQAEPDGYNTVKWTSICIRKNEGEVDAEFTRLTEKAAAKAKNEAASAAA